MNLFQSEWLREQPRPAAGSYARPAYGARYARATPAGAAESERVPAAIDLSSLTLPSPASAPRRRPVVSFDRAA